MAVAFCSMFSLSKLRKLVERERRDGITEKHKNLLPWEIIWSYFNSFHGFKWGWHFWGVWFSILQNDSQICICLMFFLMIRLRCGFWGGRFQRKSAVLITSCQGYLLSMCPILDANLNNLAEVVVILSSVKRVRGK